MIYTSYFAKLKSLPYDADWLSSCGFDAMEYEK